MQTKTIKDLLSIKFPNNLLALVGEDLLNRQKNLTEIKDIGAFLTECEQQGAQAKTAGSNRRADWEHGWSGAGVYYEDGQYNNLPYYFKKNTHIRIGNKIFQDHDGFAEVDLLRALQLIVFKSKFPKSASALVEYGCGTGSNISFLKQHLLEVDFYGTDWAKSACEKLSKNSILEPRNIRQVDYFDTKTYWAPAAPFVAFTNASLEQTGSQFQDFMSFLINCRDCVGGIHIEPIRELLDLNCELNQQSFRYAQRRNYLTGFVEFMLGQPINITCSTDFGIGSKFISGYQVFSWLNPAKSI